MFLYIINFPYGRFLTSKNESCQREKFPLDPLLRKHKVMARPKKKEDERRTVQRLTRYSPEEDKLLLENVAKANMEIGEFTRSMTLYRKFSPRRPLAEIDFLLFLRGEIGRAGNNLNQLVQRLNAANLSPTSQAAQDVINQLQEINTEVLKLLRHGHSGEK